MVGEKLAHEVYIDTAEKLRNFSESAFFRDNPEFADLTPAYEAVVQFLLDRPAMLVDDVTRPFKLKTFMFDEMGEAIEAEGVKNIDEGHALEYFKELGDCGFFGLLVGGLFWDKLDDPDKKIVVAALEWARAKATNSGIDFNEAIEYVATVKNAANYRKELHQLIPEEKVDSVHRRVPQIRTLHRDLRKHLNGMWAESEGLLNTLARYWLDTLTTNDRSTVQNIEQLFTLTGLDLLDYV